MVTDIIILVILIVFASLGFVSGLFRSIVNLAVWMLSIFMTIFYPELLVNFFTSLTPNVVSAITSLPAPLPTIFIFIFYLLIIFILGSIVNLIFTKLTHKSFLSVMDKTLGTALGVLQGILFVYLFIYAIPFFCALIGTETSTKVIMAMNDSTIASFLRSINIFF